MTLWLIGVAALGLAGFLLVRAKRARENRELERYCIRPEALLALLGERSDVLIYDVRLPLDLLAHSELIAGAERVPPKELLEHPERIPMDRDVVVYCTCPSEKTARSILKKALAMGFTRVKFLHGGLEEWKAKGFSVDRAAES